jgi:hypothetical protein
LLASPRLRLSPATGKTTSSDKGAWIRTTKLNPDESWAKLQEAEAAAAQKLLQNKATGRRPNGIEVDSKVDTGKARQPKASTAPKATAKAKTKRVPGQHLNRHALAQPATRAKAVHTYKEKPRSVAPQRQTVPEEKIFAKGRKRQRHRKPLQVQPTSTGLDAMAKIAGATQTSVARPQSAKLQLRHAQAQRATRAGAARSLKEKEQSPAEPPPRGARASDKEMSASRRSQTDEKPRVPSTPLLKLRSVDSSTGVDAMAKIAGATQTSVARPQSAKLQLRHAQAQRAARAGAARSLKEKGQSPAEPPPRELIPRSPVRSQTNGSSEEGIPPVTAEGEPRVPSIPRSVDSSALDAMAKIAGATHSRWRTVNPANEPP